MNDKNYKYVPIGKKHWCINQNFLKLICYKLFKKDVFVAKDLNLKLFVTLFLCRLKLFKPFKEIAVNQKGQFLIKVHGGYKLFDLHRSRVIKKYYLDNEQNIFEKELEQLGIIKNLSCSPFITKIDKDAIFYEEQYSRAILDLENKIYRQKEIKKIFNEYLIPLLTEIIELEKPIQIPLGKYLNEIVHKIKQSMVVHSDQKHHKIIKNFVTQTADKLKDFEKFYISLSYTHGDLSTKNMIVADNGIKLIDWEFFRKRNILFDFHNFFFHIARKNRQIVNDLHSIIESCFFDFTKKLQDYFHEEKFGYETRIYRLLYYLERVDAIIEFRELVTPEKKIRNILYNIEVFKSYENEN